MGSEIKKAIKMSKSSKAGRKPLSCINKKVEVRLFISPSDMSMWGGVVTLKGKLYEFIQGVGSNPQGKDNAIRDDLPLVSQYIAIKKSTPDEKYSGFLDMVNNDPRLTKTEKNEIRLA